MQMMYLFIISIKLKFALIAQKICISGKKYKQTKIIKAESLTQSRHSGWEKVWM